MVPRFDTLIKEPSVMNPSDGVGVTGSRKPLFDVNGRYLMKSTWWVYACVGVLKCVLSAHSIAHVKIVCTILFHG